MVDNYDSFTYNLVHLLEELGAEVVVHRSDALSPAAARALAPDRVVVSPGPGRPAAAGSSIELIRELGRDTPMLGVCLGHQAIVEAYGGETGPAKALLHGKASRVRHDGRGIFEGLPPEIDAGRYHSLASTRVPDELVVTAQTLPSVSTTAALVVSPRRGGSRSASTMRVATTSSGERGPSMCRSTRRPSCAPIAPMISYRWTRR